MKYRLGFDVGIKSVGWAVVENDINTEEPIRIADLGVRTFDANEVDKNGESTAKDRREKRGLRRRRRRKEFRKQRMLSLVKRSLGVDYEADCSSVLGEDVYKLRATALDNPVSNIEIARIIFNLLKRRGFKSSSKSKESGSEEGKLKKSIAANKKLIDEKGYRTIGEAVYKDEAYKKIVNGVEIYNVRNHNDYEHCFYRDDLKNELEQILKAQQSFGNTAVTDEFIDKAIEIFAAQRNFDEGPGENSKYKLSGFSVGNCTFISTEIRAPKASATFEMFNALSKLNSLLINGEPLNSEQREILLNKVLNYTDIKFSEIRKWLKLDYTKTFNLCNYFLKQKEKEGKTDEEIIDKCEDKCLVSFKNTKEIKKATGLLPNGNEELFNEIAIMLSFNKSESNIDKYIKDHNSMFKMLSNTQIEKIKTLNFDKFGNLSIVAMDKIIPYLKEGKKYDEACKCAGYNHSQLSHEKHKFLRPQDIKEKLDDITVPTVKRAVNQTIRILNKIVKKYGSPQFVTIELSRDFDRTPNERDKIEKAQNERYRENQEHIAEIMKYKSKPSGNDILKLRLYNEQDCKCMYSGERIDIEKLFSDNYYQIDHAIPISRSLDDSYTNKVLVKTAENQRKGNMTPFEYFNQYKTKADWDNYVVRVNNLKNVKKRSVLLTEKYSENRQKDFIERNSNDTRYISRAMLNILQNYLQTEPNKKYVKVIKSINGGVTAYLRKCWGINKIREDGDSHHSVDAAVIAVATDSMVKNITEFNKRKEQYIFKDGYYVDINSGEKVEGDGSKVSRVLAMPYDNFVKELALRSTVKYDENCYGEQEIKALSDLGYIEEELESAKPLFVSRMKTIKKTGAIHKDTMMSTKIYDEKGLLIKTVPLNVLTLEEKPEPVAIKGDLHPDCRIKDYCKPLDDRKLYLVLKEMLVADKDSLKKLPFVTKPSKNGKDGAIVKKVKVYVKNSNVVRINGGAFEADRMYRIDLFKKDNKYYAIPIYIKDVYAHKLPNKVVIRDKPWVEIDNTYEFQFSLYQNDLVKIEWNKPAKFSKVRDDEKSTKPKNIELTEGYFYYNGFGISTSSIGILTCDRCYQINSVGIQGLKNITKYYVDIMGNIYKAPKEKRENV